MKTRKFLPYISALLLFTACNDDYLERYPLSELAPETYFRTAA